MDLIKKYFVMLCLVTYQRNCKRKEKIGFSTPMKDIIKTNIIKFIMETSRNKSFLEASYWDGKEISKNIEKYYLSNNESILKNYWKVINAFHLLN